MTIRLAALLTAALAAPPAVAQQPSEHGSPGDFTRETWPTELTRRPLTLAPGMLELTLPVNANLSTGKAFEPTFLNPSLYYGVTRDLTVGVRHFVGVCVTGSDHGCNRVYDDVSIDTIWSLYRGSAWDAALGAALNATSFDPFTLSAEGRVALRWRSDWVAVTLAPQVNFGLTQRDAGRSFIAGGGGGSGATTALGNREVLTVPLGVQVQATRQLAVSVGAALSGPLDPPTGSFGDFYAIPASAAVDYALSSTIDLGAAFAFTNLAGKNSSTDDRFGKVYARVRF